MSGRHLDGCAFRRGRWVAIHSASPNITILKRDPYNDPDVGEGLMEFRLTYEGLLLGPSKGNGRVEHKHELRRHFHKQLMRLWKIYPALNGRMTPIIHPQNRHVSWAAIPPANYLARRYERFGFKFVPLVYSDLSLLCSISVLFLRPDTPGQVLKSGDLDNRMKTLLDALCMPQHLEQIRGSPGDDEEPFFCLLEDDSQITHLSVETDTLFEPTGEAFDPNDARLILTIKIRPYSVNDANQGFG